MKASLPFDLEFIADTPYRGDGPELIIFDLFAKSFDMHIHSAGIADIFIAPDMIQELFPGKYLIGRRSKKI